MSSAIEYFRNVVTAGQDASVASFSGKVVGTYCNFVPEEIVYALGAVPVRLCSGDVKAVGSGEIVFPRDTCSLVKACVGDAVVDTALFARTDLLVIPTPCDAKKKLGGVMESYKTVHILQLPPSKSTSPAGEFWLSQIWDLTARLEKLTGRKLTAHNLQSAIELLNRRTAMFRRFLELRKAAPCSVTGEEALMVTQSSFVDDPARWTENLERLCDERESFTSMDNGAPRLLLTGAPVLYPNLKLLRAIEEAGAAVAFDDTCAGAQRLYNSTVARDASLRKLVEAVAEKCLLPSTCPCFVEQTDRLNRIFELVDDFAIQGVVCHTLRVCPLFDIETIHIERELKRREIPCLVLSTDYSLEDTAQIRTRVEAFVEMMSAM